MPNPLKKVKDAAKWVDDITEFEAGPKPETEPDPAPQPKPKPTFHVVAGLLVALVLTAGCKYPIEGTPTPAPTTVATCDEDQPWCWDCSRDGNKICGPIEVQR